MPTISVFYGIQIMMYFYDKYRRPFVIKLAKFHRRFFLQLEIVVGNYSQKGASAALSRFKIKIDRLFRGEICP